jgi:Spy/CpxP family protein refolding chaperone
MSITRLTVSALLGIGTAFTAGAVPPEPAMAESRHEQHMLSWLAELDLTPEQRQQIQALRERYQARGHDLRQRAADIREQLLNATPDDPAYADVTARSAEAAALLAADLVRFASELRAEVHGLLTPAQREAIKTRLREKRERWEQWRQRHQPPAEPNAG